MRYLNITLLFAVAALICFSSPVRSDVVTSDEALQIANNWVRLIIHTTGSWGGYDNAEISNVEEFRSGERLLGYYCPVESGGYVIVSLIKGLAPVKTYSGSSTLDPEAEDGPTDLIKFQMERMLNEVEAQAGPAATVSIQEVEQLLEYKYKATLDKLNVSSEDFLQELALDADKANYVAGDSLLTSSWHQFYPYFLQTPAAHNGCTETNCSVGCVALAGAQIMRYWSWPPGRRWDLMYDVVDQSSPTQVMDSIAELCFTIGVFVGMDWCSDGCLSSVPTANMESVYEIWKYEDCSVFHRRSFAGTLWWEMVKPQLNVNRPIQYRIMGHSIVLDGWREWHWGSYQPEYHMNYGWNDDNNAWFALDGLLQVVDTASWVQEYMITGIVPIQSLGDMFFGPLSTLPFPYRYVDRDCIGTAAEFQAGQFIQFLPGVKLTCGAETVRFNGDSRNQSVLYTPIPDRGIKIYNGAMVMHTGCEIRFQQSRPGP